MSLSVLLFSLFAAFSAQALEYKTYPLRTSDYSAQLNYLTVNANYASGGGIFNELASGNSYKVTQIDGSYRNVFAKKWAYYAGGQFAMAESQSPMDIKTNSGLTHLLGGFDFIMYEGSMQLIPDFWLLYPITRNNFTGDSVALSEGAMQIGARMIAQTNLQRLRLAFHLGYVYRDEGRAALMPYGASMEVRMKTWSFGGELKGANSMGYDSDTNNTGVRTAWAALNNGTSLLFGSVNPQILEANGYAKWVLNNRMLVQAGLAMTLNGSNTASYMSIFGGMLWRFPPESTRTQSDETVERFEPETPKAVNHQYFAPGSQEQAEEEEESMPPPPRRRAAPAPAPRKTQELEPSLQEQLDKTEMQLKLKTDKKRPRGK